MQAQRRYRKVLLTPHLMDLHQIRKAAHLPLDRLETNIPVQLRQQVLQLLRRRLRLRRGLFFRFRLLLLLLRRLFPGSFRRLGFPLRHWRSPEICSHPLQVVLRHGADHLHLLENDLVLFALVLTRHVLLPDPNPS